MSWIFYDIANKENAALRAEIERLTAENEAIRKDRDDLLQQALGVEAERDIARMENEKLRAAERETFQMYVDANEALIEVRAALQRYGQHDVGCEPETWHGKGPICCSCGYSDAFIDNQQLTPQKE